MRIIDKERIETPLLWRTLLGCVLKHVCTDGNCNLHCKLFLHQLVLGGGATEVRTKEEVHHVHRIATTAFFGGYLDGGQYDALDDTFQDVVARKIEALPKHRGRRKYGDVGIGVGLIISNHQVRSAAAYIDTRNAYRRRRRVERVGAEFANSIYIKACIVHKPVLDFAIDESQLVAGSLVVIPILALVGIAADVVGVGDDGEVFIDEIVAKIRLQRIESLLGVFAEDYLFGLQHCRRAGEDDAFEFAREVFLTLTLAEVVTIDVTYRLHKNLGEGECHQRTAREIRVHRRVGSFHFGVLCSLFALRFQKFAVFREEFGDAIECGLCKLLVGL